MKKDIRMLNRLGFILFFTLLSAVGIGRDFYVSLNGTNGFPYTNWPDAATNIQWAVNVGTNSDTVWISNGTYYLTNQITVSSNINIVGFNGRPVIDGINSNRCFYITATYGGMLSNLFIMRGNTNGDGGGAYIVNNGGNVYSCVFSNNTATNKGGGLYGGTQIVSCTFVGNSAKNGGGLFPYSGANTFVADCTFQTNIAIYGGSYGGGGGMYVTTFRLVTNCAFIGNVAGSGGGLYGDGAGYMINCPVVSNIAETSGGGGLYINHASCIVSNCFINSNIATNNGGGVYLLSGTLRLYNCTVVSNYSREGGAIDGAYLVKVENSIIYFNAVNNYTSSKASFTNCCTIPDQAGWVTGNITNNPMFVNTNVGNWRLKTESPCVNKGVNRDWMTNAFDLDNRIRIRYGTVDMGCYERVYGGTVYQSY